MIVLKTRELAAADAVQPGQRTHREQPCHRLKHRPCTGAGIFFLARVWTVLGPMDSARR
ncbi:MAG: hypothetical protein WDO12_09285 [Pseudomonadota bacterium]